MKFQKESPSRVLDRFVENLGETLPSNDQTNESTESVLDILRAKCSKRQPTSEVRRTKSLVARFSWLPATAVAIVVLLAAALMSNVLWPIGAVVVVDTAEGDPLLHAGQPIKLDQTFRTGENSWTVLSLADGSHVEMGAGTEFSIGKAVDGIRLDLLRGSVIVTAAKQRHGHLYVQTKDCIVSVVGTVFSVNAEPSGSRVSVIAGEVHVQQGHVLRTLAPGQQMSTSPEMKPVLVSTQIGWSRNVESLVTLLEQSVAPPALAQNEPDIIRGIVTRVDTSEGIPDVHIMLCPSSGSMTSDSISGYTVDQIKKKERKLQEIKASACRDGLNTITDGMGRFAIKGLVPGKYTIRAEHNTYVAASVESAAPGLVSATSIVDTQQVTGEVAISMARGATLSGRIRDAAGNLLINASVQAAVMSIQNGTPTLRNVMTKETNDIGEYRLYSLPPGAYFISVIPHAPGSFAAGYKFKVPNVPVSQSNAESASMQTFYGGATNLADATTVVVKQGDELSSLDIIVRSVPPAH